MGTEAEETDFQGHRTYTGMTAEGEAAVGRIAIWAARVEENLVRLCVQLINMDNFHIGYAVTAKMTASAVADLVKKLVTDSKSISDEDRTYLLKIIVEAKAALVQRNEVLHASVGLFIFGDKSVFSRRKKGTASDGQDQFWESTLRGTEELDAIGAQLFKVSENLEAYVEFPWEWQTAPS